MSLGTSENQAPTNDDQDKDLCETDYIHTTSKSFPGWRLSVTLLRLLHHRKKLQTCPIK